MAKTKWRAVNCVANPKFWGFETDNPEAVADGEELIVPFRLFEDEARRIVAEHNSN